MAFYRKIGLATAGAAALMASASSWAGTVLIVSDQYPASTLNNFYNSYGGHSSSIGSGTVDQLALSGVDLLWLIQPADGYSALELTAMSSYLAGGGRIAFMGEHGGFLPNENNRINVALTAIGSTIQIVNKTEDAGFRSASVDDGQIMQNPLTAGVLTYQYAAFAPLLLSGSAQSLMIGEDTGSTMMAYQNIGAGSVFLISDQNVWDNASNLWGSFDNEVMFNNLVSASTVTPSVPEPGTWLMMMVGFGLVGGAARYRRRRTKAAIA